MYEGSIAANSSSLTPPSPPPSLLSLPLQCNILQLTSNVASPALCRWGFIMVVGPHYWSQAFRFGRIESNSTKKDQRGHMLTLCSKPFPTSHLQHTCSPPQCNAMHGNNHTCTP
eukprot:scpid72556/ scgid31942/ 